MAVNKNKPIVEEKSAETSKVVSKKYNPEDKILCRSITSGGLYVVGERTKFLYTFADYGDEVDVEYQDLNYMLRSKDKAIYEPRFIILDEEVYKDYPEIIKMYDALWTVNDLKEIINMPESQMEYTINTLPKGAIEALKGLISTMLDNKSLDSITKVKSLDRILGTNLLLGLAEN